MRIWVLGLVLAVSVPALAAACACCDGGLAREVVGWSTGGDALVRATHLGCEDHLAFEVWRPGASEPAGCFDAYGDDPERSVACDALAYGFDQFPANEPRPRARIPHAAEYSVAATRVPANDVRATLTPAGDGAELRVEVRVGSRWQEILVRSLPRLGTPEIPLDDDDIEALPMAEQADVWTPRAIDVRVWRGPARSLVEVGGFDSSPGTGFWEDILAWVDLPETSTAPAAAPPTFAVFAHGSPAIATRSQEEDLERRLRAVNRLALRHHRRGEFRESAELFARLLFAAPSNAVYRYNLACALARLGQERAALRLLEELATASDCDRCEERLRRARRDPDLRRLRDRLPTPP
ncbi:MAG: hypothetical protein AAGE52_23475 [Myxococcota bacterium]